MFSNMNLAEMALRIPVIILAMSVHEFSHGLAAYMLGDSTAKHDGRLSLNPLKHIDPVGMLFLLVFSFGWAKPVQVDARNFKYPKHDMALTAAAGPLSNFVFAFITLLVYYPLSVSAGIGGTATGYAARFLWQLFIINICLGILNMMPIPPLDGSKVFAFPLPDSFYFKFISSGKYGFVVLMIFIYTGLYSDVLHTLLNTIVGGYYFLIEGIFFSIERIFF